MVGDRDASGWRSARLPPLFSIVVVMISAAGQVFVIFGHGSMRGLSADGVPPVLLAAVLISICMFGAVGLYGGVQALVASRNAVASLDIEIERALAAMSSSAARAADHRAFEAERDLLDRVPAAATNGPPSDLSEVTGTVSSTVLRSSFGVPGMVIRPSGTRSFVGDFAVRTESVSGVGRQGAGFDREFDDWVVSRDARSAMLGRIEPGMPVTAIDGRELGQVVALGSDQIMVEGPNGQGSFVASHRRIVAVDGGVILAGSESDAAPSPGDNREQAS